VVRSDLVVHDGAALHDESADTAQAVARRNWLPCPPSRGDGVSAQLVTANIMDMLSTEPTVSGHVCGRAGAP